VIRGFQPSPPSESTAPKFSRLGLASFALGLLSLLLAGGFVALAVRLGLEEGRAPQRSVSLGGLVLLAVVLLVSLTGTVLGLAGLARPVRRRTYGLLGIAFNGLTLSLFCALVVLALLLPGFVGG